MDAFSVLDAFRWNKDRSRERLAHPVAEVAIEAAWAGGLGLLRFFRKELRVQTKGVANFVSEADLAAESAVVSAIRSRFPDHAVISEETHSDRADSEHLWIIDPLDGTNNYLHGMPHFAVSIGYYERGVGKVGVICNPAVGDWFVGAEGKGAWANGERSRVSSAKGLSDAMVSCGFYYDRGKMMQTTLDTLAELFRSDIHGMRRCGAAALDLAYLACGWFDVFFEYRLSPWDYAAGGVLLREAGGTLTDCSGAELPLGRHSSVCATNGHLHDSMLAVVGPRWQKLRSEPRV
jgi:myo-inositol-1(or 4)-monophosphatase